MNDLNEIQCFVKAVELKSLTAAAKALGLPKSSMSRKIKNLESRLGMTLLTRTTRALNLTEAGKGFFERTVYALKEIEHAEESLEGSRKEVEGLLRITAPAVLASGPFNEFIASFMGMHPKVKVEILITERVVDLIAESFDFAFRMGSLKDSTLMAKRIMTMDAYVMASPKYLKRAGTPRSITDLAEHTHIVFAPDGEALPWILKNGSSKKTIIPKGPLLVNHLQSLKESAINGMGLAFLPEFLAHQELENKTLKRVCPEWESTGNPIHLVYPGQKFLSPKMRAFIDFASKSFLV
jgi:DNA-binding transcriptional LysR family regulator